MPLEAFSKMYFIQMDRVVTQYGENNMKLREVIENIEQLNSEHTIYAQEPWNENSNVVVAMEPEQGGLPPEA